MTTPPDDEVENILLDIYQLGVRLGKGKTGHNGVGLKYAKSVPEALAALNALVEREKIQANIELVENLLEAQDQGIDLDGRPVAGPYYIFGGDGEQYYLADLLKQLRKQLKGMVEV